MNEDSHIYFAHVQCLVVVTKQGKGRFIFITPCFGHHIVQN